MRSLNLDPFWRTSIGFDRLFDLMDESLRFEPEEIGDALDLDTLLHPAKAFARPLDVVRDPDLTLNEKRAILASWASDACAIEAAPELRATPGGSTPVRFDDIIDALRTLDRQASEQYKAPPHYRRVLDRRTSSWRKVRPTG